MQETAKRFVAGVITIGMITAFGLHAKGLASLVSKAGNAGQGILGAAINPPKGGMS